MAASTALQLMFLVSLAAAVSIRSEDPTPTSDTVTVIDIKMKGAQPQENDAYLCSSYEMKGTEDYIVKFEALANVSVAHHILMFGCNGAPARKTDVWECPPICEDGSEQIMFAWAKAAPPTKLPKDVGFRVGKSSTIKTIVLQVHYKYAFKDNHNDDSGIRIYVTSQRQKYVAGIHLMLSYSIRIPPDTNMTHADISCHYQGAAAMHPFAYRTHAHGLGTVITGYLNNGSWYEIGKGNPQWPQAFYPAMGKLVVEPGDGLAARCSFNSTGRFRVTNIGPTGADEMCNFYIMYYTDSSVKMPYSQCGGNRVASLIDNIPADSDVPLPPNPEMEEHAKGHNHAHVSMAPTGGTENTEKPEKPMPPLKFDKQWPLDKVEFGQVGGVATDQEGNVYVFHRGDRQWDASSFDIYNKFQDQTPIKEEVIVIMNKTGHVIRQFGSNQFYMPHGIEVDKKGNIWLTDVALHQVMRIPKGASAPNLVLGTAFEPDNDHKHFCKPSDIAVLDSGDFYVTDGYCNSRVLKYNSDGTLLKEWGQADLAVRDGASDALFRVPHSVTIAEKEGLVCVADRENGRIQCFDLDGEFQFILKEEQFGPRLFAIEYCPLHGGLLFAVNGPSFDEPRAQVKGFTISLPQRKVVQTWNLPEKGMQNPHDLAVDPTSHAVFVGELNPTRVWRFTLGKTTEVPDKKGFTNAQETDKPGVKSEEGSHTTAPAESSDEASKLETSDGEKKEVKDKNSDFMPSIVIGVLLIVPVVLLLVITIIVRLHHSGKISCFSGKKQKVFSLQSFLGNSHKGFDRLSTEESDHELDPLDDSDHEEYTAPSRKQKA